MVESLLKSESRVYSRISVEVTGYHGVRAGGWMNIVNYTAFANMLTIIFYTVASGYVPLGAFGPILHFHSVAEWSLACRFRI